MKIILINIAFNAILWASGYLWIIGGSPNGESLFKFLFWVSFTMATLAFIWAMAPERKYTKPIPTSALPGWLYVSFDVAMALCLAWFGHGWLAGVLVISTTFEAIARETFAKDREAQQKQSNRAAV